LSSDQQMRPRTEHQPDFAGRPIARPPRPRSTKALRLGGMLVIAALAILGVGLLARSVARAASAGRATPAASARQSGRGSTPTAVFAHIPKYRVAIHFPATASDMIAVGFHQAYNPKAFALAPTMRTLAIDKPSLTEQLLASDSSLKLFDQALRGRGSAERSAADCAVLPSTRLVSPATGTVTLLKHYKLEGRIDDLQLEIQPDGAPLLRVVMIHIKNVTVKAGDRVIGGVTPVATVRHLTLDSSVNRYLPVSPADHTHIQVNDQRYRLPSS